MKLILLLVALVTLSHVSVVFGCFIFPRESSRDTLICYADNDVKSLSKYMGSLTGYDNNLMKGDITESKENDCKAEKVWLYSRHGTRYPKKSFIMDAKSKLPMMAKIILMKYENASLTKSCQGTINMFKNWSWANINESFDHLLHPVGMKELESLGKRVKQRFPELFASYVPQQTKIAFTDKIRAKDSGMSFLKGLYPNVTRASDFDVQPPNKMIPVLNGYSNCSNWTIGVKENASRNIEETEYIKANVYQEMLRDVRSRTGLMNLTEDEVELIYSTCAYDLAQTNKMSPWCTVFTVSDLEVMNYREDISIFVKSGPSHMLNSVVSCGTLQEIVAAFKDNNTANGTGWFRFSHAGGIVKLYTLFGLFNFSSPLSSSNIHRERERDFRTSYMVPLGANMMLVLYKCGETKKVGFFTSEKETRLPFCDTERLCPLDMFLKKYGDVERQICGNLSEVCPNLKTITW